MAPDLVSEFVRTFNDEINRTSRDRDHRREGLQREQKDLERRIDTLLDAFASGALKGPSVQTKLETLEARQGEVAKELAGLLGEPAIQTASFEAIRRSRSGRRVQKDFCNKIYRSRGRSLRQAARPTR